METRRAATTVQRPCHAAAKTPVPAAPCSIFFINGRFVKNRTMMAALEAAYKGVTDAGTNSRAVCFRIAMPPQLVDVNVHPAKTEVRFAREKDVFDAVYQSVKCVLITPQSTEKVFSFGGAERAFPADEKAPDAAAKKEPSESAPAEEPARGPGALRPASRAVPDAPVRPVPARPEPSAVPLPGQVKAYSEMITALSSESTVPYRSAKAPDIWADEDAAEDVGFMPHTVCRRQEGTPGVQTLPEDRALNSFAAGETAGTESPPRRRWRLKRPIRLLLRLWKKNSGAIRFVLWARCLTRTLSPNGETTCAFWISTPPTSALSMNLWRHRMGR